MINIKSTDHLMLKSFQHIFNQTNLKMVHDDHNDSFADIKIETINNKLLLKIDDYILNLRTPLSFKKIFLEINKILSKKKITFLTLVYLPFQQKLENSDSAMLMNDIHNTLFSYLYLHRKEGIDKFDLYKKIWPKDKNFHINKIDSHLSNLKNEIKSRINFNFEYSSKKKLIRLITN
tara:strand:+ start:9233 stop:9763 length:531 start_codon:yes stop_codon:yes gene_type:complete